MLEAVAAQVQAFRRRLAEAGIAVALDPGLPLPAQLARLQEAALAAMPPRPEAAPRENAASPQAILDAARASTHRPGDHAPGEVEEVPAIGSDVPDARRHLQHFELLAHTAEQLLQSTTPQREVESLCRRVMELLDCQVFFNFLADARAGRLHLNACAGIPEAEAQRITWLEYGAAVCGCVARDGCRVVAEHIPTTPDPRTAVVKAYGITAYACHPLLAPGGRVIGTLSFGTRTRETFRDDELSLMRAVADQVAMAMVRMQEEAALRLSEARLRAHMENSPLAVIEFDADLRITRWSPEAERMFGWTADETIGKTSSEMSWIYKDDVALVMAESAGLLDGTRPRALSIHRNYRKDGTVILCERYDSAIYDADGCLVSILSQVLDITERHRAEAEREALLAQVEQHAAELDAIFTALPFLISVHDREGRYLRVNPAIVQLFGFDPTQTTREETARRLRARLPDGQPLTPEHMPSDTALRGEIVRDVPYLITDARGKDRVLMFNAIPLLADGQVYGAIFAQADITELHALQEQERLLLHTVAHDLRAPATLINGNLELLLERIEPSSLDASLQPVVEALRRALRRMNVMVDDLTEVTRLDASIPLQKEPVALPAYLTELVQRHAPVLDLARIQLDLPDALPPVPADPARLERILINLLLNAQKYSDAGTPIRVSACRREGDLLLRVSDRGQGIPCEDQPHIFDRFYRSKYKRRADGIGLGLYITRALVEAHGGRIQVESTPGQGSTFAFSLPLA